MLTMSQENNTFPCAPINPTFQTDSQARYQRLRDKLQAQQRRDFTGDAADESSTSTVSIVRGGKP